MDYKRQHHVEANYLRGFSKDEATFDIYLLKQGRVLQQKPIREQCRDDWYYEKGGDFERTLKKIEDIVAKFKKDVQERNITLEKGNDAHKCLAMGAIIQRIRGPEYLDWMKNIAEKTNQVKVRGKESGNPLDRSDLLGGVIDSAHSIYDLDLRILRAEESDLITSDNPVAAQNRIVKRHDRMGNTGFRMLGLELIWPLNPKTALYFFDNNSYQCVGDFGETIKINKEEIDEINGLQVQNAIQCLYAQEWKESMNQTVARYREARAQDTDLKMTEEDGSIIVEMSKQDRVTKPWNWRQSTCRLEAKVCSLLWGKRRDDLFQELDSGRHSSPVNDSIRGEISAIFLRPPEGVSLPTDFTQDRGW